MRSKNNSVTYVVATACVILLIPFGFLVLLWIGFVFPEEVFLMRVNRLLHEKKYEEVIDLVNPEIEKYPSSELFEWRARAFAGIGEWDKAILDHRSAIKSEKVLFDLLPKECLRNYIAEGRIQESLGRRTEAKSVYTRMYKVLQQKGLPIDEQMLNAIAKHRIEIDRIYKFEEPQYSRSGSKEEIKASKRKAALEWLQQFVEEFVEETGDSQKAPEPPDLKRSAARTSDGAQLLVPRACMCV